MTAKEDIIKAMRTLMYRKGYVATSISDVLEEAQAGKGQLYHYFTSKKDLGLSAAQALLKDWRQDLIEDIFQSDKDAQEKFVEMLNWVYQFHEEQEIFCGCPVGNLIVELSTQEEDFRLLLQAFIEDWLNHLADLLRLLHPSWPKRRAAQESQQLLAAIEGSIVLLKVSQDLTILSDNLQSLQQRYLPNR